MPPTFLWATSQDEQVPVQQSLILARALPEFPMPDFHGHDFFETGLSADLWKGKWVTSPFDHPYTAIQNLPMEELLGMFAKVESPENKANEDRDLHPAEYYRKTFSVENKQIACARLYVTAHGVYEPYVNGQPAGDGSVLNPGFTVYPEYLEYRTYKLDNLEAGENVIALKVGDGWYRGKFGVLGFGANYGDHLGIRRVSLSFYVENALERGRKRDGEKHTC